MTSIIQCGLKLPFSHINGWDWISNCNPHLNGHMDYKSVLGLLLIHVSKRGFWRSKVSFMCVLPLSLSSCIKHGVILDHAISGSANHYKIKSGQHTKRWRTRSQQNMGQLRCNSSKCTLSRLEWMLHGILSLWLVLKTCYNWTGALGVLVSNFRATV